MHWRETQLWLQHRKEDVREMSESSNLLVNDAKDKAQEPLTLPGAASRQLLYWVGRWTSRSDCLEPGLSNE